MNIIKCAIIILVVTIPIYAQIQVSVNNADYHARLALTYLLKAIPECDRPYTRFITFYNIPDKVLQTRINTLRFWLPSMSFLPESIDGAFTEVPGSASRLFAIDLRDYGWLSDAFTAVALREPYCIFPAIDNDINILLQKETWTTDIKNEQYHNLAMIRADFLFRDTVETDRSTSYYDLLFAHKRFTYKTENKYFKGNQEFKPGNYDYHTLITTDFPKDESDWEKAFGVDKINEFVEREKISVKNGAIVEEGYSIVARNNRLVLRLQGPIKGGYYKTFDVSETAGNKDFTEKLFFNFEFDAAEYIATLPNGAQAYLLTNNKGKRLEVADNRFATDNSDTRNDKRVRNPGSCVICHVDGINPPHDHFTSLNDQGVEFKALDRRKFLDVKAFFTKWERTLKNDQGIYQDFVLNRTKLKSRANASNFLAFRNEYDDPLTIDTISLEIGIPVEVIKDYASRSPKGRLQSIVQGIKTPRNTFEKNVYRELMLLKSAKPHQ